jgi:hypothetical protein
MQHKKKPSKSFLAIHRSEIRMKTFRPFVLRGMLCCFFALMAGCASSQLVDVWSDSTFQAPPLNKILVISVSRNPAQRRLWEDAFSSGLSNHGVAATPSYRLFPDAVPDTSQVIQVVQSNGFDGILVCRRLPAEAYPQYTEGYVTTEQSLRYSRRGQRFMTYYRDVAHPATVDSQKVDIRGIDVWATRNEGQMIWTATSETPEPNAVQEVRSEIVNLVMVELKNRKIIASK